MLQYYAGRSDLYVFVPGVAWTLFLFRLSIGSLERHAGRFILRVVFEISLNLFACWIVAEMCLLWVQSWLGLGSGLAFGGRMPFLAHATLFGSLFIYLKVGLWTIQRNVGFLASCWPMWKVVARTFNVLGALAWVVLLAVSVLFSVTRLLLDFGIVG
ncbi:MAG: hypothetical protein JJU02_17105 [Cryomorphaceae bacterium]|nr:hypothetical protein [Cryomorphaceae bacterium]